MVLFIINEQVILNLYTKWDFYTYIIIINIIKNKIPLYSINPSIIIIILYRKLNKKLSTLGKVLKKLANKKILVLNRRERRKINHRKWSFLKYKYSCQES